MRQPRRILARQGAAPAPSRCIRRRRRSTPQPLTGEPFGRKPFAKPPLQGEVDAPQGADGGVHCRLAAEISGKARQNLALYFVGDDACIVPEPLRCRRPPAAGEIARPTLRPGASGNRYASANRQARRRADEIIGPYAEGRRDTACRPRFRHPFALHCRAGVHARRGGLRRPGRILARSCAAPLCWLTPTAPLTGEPSGRQSPQSLPCKGRWMRRKAQTEGCIAGWRRRYPAKPGRTLPYTS